MDTLIYVMGDQAEAICKQIIVADGDEDSCMYNNSRTVAAFETYFKFQSIEINYRIMFSKRNQNDENLIRDLHDDLSLKCCWDKDHHLDHRKSQMSTQ